MKDSHLEASASPLSPQGQRTRPTAKPPKHLQTVGPSPRRSQGAAVRNSAWRSSTRIAVRLRRPLPRHPQGHCRAVTWQPVQQRRPVDRLQDDRAGPAPTRSGRIPRMFWSYAAWWSLHSAVPFDTAAIPRGRASRTDVRLQPATTHAAANTPHNVVHTRASPAPGTLAGGPADRHARLGTPARSPNPPTPPTSSTGHLRTPRTGAAAPGSSAIAYTGNVARYIPAATP